MTQSIAEWAVWVPSTIAFGCACGLSCAGSRLRRTCAVSLATLGLAAPLWAPPTAMLRALVALFLLWSWVKVRDMSLDPTPRTARFRVIQVLVLYDLRLDRAAALGRGRISASGWLAAGAAGVGAAVALTLALSSDDVTGGRASWLLRHGAGLAFSYLAVESIVRLLSGLYAACGLHPPTLHDHPILSRSVAEFWGQRWNRMVGRWLRDTYFRPLARRRRPWLGMVVAFVASAILHFYFSWLALDVAAGLTMAAFFLLQIPIVALERWLGLSRLRPAWQRAWTVFWLVGLSPLFVGPLLTILESPA